MLVGARVLGLVFARLREVFARISASISISGLTRWVGDSSVSISSMTELSALAILPLANGRSFDRSGRSYDETFSVATWGADRDRLRQRWSRRRKRAVELVTRVMGALIVWRAVPG